MVLKIFQAFKYIMLFYALVCVCVCEIQLPKGHHSIGLVLLFRVDFTWKNNSHKVCFACTIHHNDLSVRLGVSFKYFLLHKFASKALETSNDQANQKCPRKANFCKNVNLFMREKQIDNIFWLFMMFFTCNSMLIWLQLNWLGKRKRQT